MFFRQNEKFPDQKSEHGVRHIAFIMDGNGRWAKKRGMPREFGHREGAKAFQRVVEYCGDIGIEYVTVYAFSTENWKRPENEVKAIMQLFTEYMSEAFRVFAEKGLRIRFIGDRSRFDADLLCEMNRLEQDSKDNKKVLNVAFNYGGREDILHAVKVLASEGKDFTEENLTVALYTEQCPEPDLIVRTGGEMRISNFLLWQSAYAELYFTDTLWPDMQEKDVDAAVAEFARRNRRFGGV
ncbi:MAG: di-trans,poly-cis-decaprenylcistransferase [Ruminococcaceae bacterium]|nr:di-trans,poly-cis-decaprenylcistransferase [Oscillospiraceae bacterium]